MKEIFGKDVESIMKNALFGRRDLVIAGILRYFYRLRGNKGTKVVEEDWDYLIILDACRYDFFEKIHEEFLKGDLQSRKSRGSMSLEFLNRNFTDYHEDLIYVSANGLVNPYKDIELSGQDKFDSSSHFEEIYPVYLEGETEKGVATPESVKEHALKAIKDNPEKRCIIHFNQPHLPFIGEYNLGEEGQTYRDFLEEGFSWDQIKSAYESNLRRALDNVEELIEYLDGKVVVSADHGELLGEWGMTTHPYGIYKEELVKVPWLIINKDESKEIESTVEINSKNTDEEENEEKVKEQLEKLGYI